MLAQRRWFWASLIIAALLPIPVGLAVQVFQQANLAAKESAQQALLSEMQRELDAHYHIHGRYPESLAALQLTYPDGGNATLLPEFRYRTDGAAYVLEVRGAFTQTVRRICR